MMRQFDLVVIGSGPSGQKAAVQAAKLGKQVAVVEKLDVIGGACLHTGTIPSKALRQTTVDLVGRNSIISNNRQVHRFTLDELVYWTEKVIRAEVEVIRSQMYRNGVTVLTGVASFEGPNTVLISREHESEKVQADYFILATGTRPAHHPDLPYDNIDIIDSDGLLQLQGMPKSIIIVGGGVIGTEYACILGTLGVKVTLVEARDALLEFADREIIEALQYHMRNIGITLRLGEKVEKTEVIQPQEAQYATKGLVVATLASGKTLRADTLMYCIGRQGATENLGLDKIGLKADSRGRVKVNENYQTEVPNVYAVGDLIGFPALASTSMEQGRLAACHMFGQPAVSFPQLFPYGIYSIPELSMVGKTETDLTAANVPYETGIARYRELARGELLNDEIGMLKMLIHEKTREILGVHIIGTNATELVHIGQTAMAFHATVDFFINNVFNYPTLAEAYKVAALNASNKLAIR